MRIGRKVDVYYNPNNRIKITIDQYAQNGGIFLIVSFLMFLLYLFSIFLFYF
ncbi:hypothetical protein [Bacillus sp. JCM 19041]|uniref:hypothetical protein n=1 Tax=Bacillus sp. JCM 19041 TaxID=1460637 RepID=UPI000A8D9C43